MSFLSRAALAWNVLTKDAGDGPYGSLAPFLEVYGSNKSKTGQTVNWSTALGQSVICGITRVLCDGVSQVPLKLMRENSDGGSSAAKDHELYYVMHRRPNPWQTSFAFRETMMLHLILCGNFFAFKNKVSRKVRELIPIMPGNVEVKQNRDYSLTYKIRDEAGNSQEFPQESILHVRGPSWNSWIGMDAVKMAREAIGLSMAIEADQASLYKNGLRTSGTYSVEGNLNEAQYNQLRKFIAAYQAGDRGGPLILDRAAKYFSETMNSVDAETMASRAFQVEEMCRPFRVMPIMIGHSDKAATYASAEQMFLAHVVHTLMPWYERLQQEFDEQLLDQRLEPDLHFKFIEHGLLRGSFETQAKGFSMALGSGGGNAWMTTNEVRARLDMNPIDGGDELPKPPEPKPAQQGNSSATQSGKNEENPFDTQKLAELVTDTIRAMPAPVVTVNAPDIKIEPPDISVTMPPVSVTVHAAKRGSTKKVVDGYDDDGRITSITETEIEE